MRERLHLHAGARRTDAARGEDPLAFDLDHAGAAVAVRPVAGLGRIAQMRDARAVALRDLPDGLALARLDLFAVEREADGLLARALALHLVGGTRVRDVRPAFDLGVAAGGTLVVVVVPDGFGRVVHR